MKQLLALTAALLLAACVTPAPDRPMPHYTYQQYPVQTVNVASIQVVEAYTPPMQNPNVEHLMPDPLPAAVAAWAHNRFKAGGSDGELVITIKNAAVTSSALPTSTGVKGVLNVEQAEKFDAHVNVEFKAGNMAANPDGAGSVHVDRGQSVGENASVQERDRVLTSMEETLLTDLDAGTQTMFSERLPFLIQR